MDRSISRQRRNGTQGVALWVYADSERFSIEYDVAGIHLPEKNRITYPVREAILMDSAGNRFGIKGAQASCTKNSAGGYHLIQNFYDTFTLTPPERILPRTINLMIGDDDAYPDERYTE